MTMAEETKPPKLVFGQAGAGIVVPVDCEISVPTADGEGQRQILTGRFQVMGQSEINAFYASGGGGDPALLRAALKGFADFTDEEGKPVDDDVAVPAMLELPYVRLGLIQGYFQMLQGRPGKLEKN